MQYKNVLLITFLNMNNLSTKNPKQLTYQNQLLKITILGGIKIEGLDRMRTTLKIQVKEESTQEELQNLAEDTI